MQRRCTQHNNNSTATAPERSTTTTTTEHNNDKERVSGAFPRGTSRQHHQITTTTAREHSTTPTPHVAHIPYDKSAPFHVAHLDNITRSQQQQHESTTRARLSTWQISIVTDTRVWQLRADSANTQARHLSYMATACQPPSSYGNRLPATFLIWQPPAS